MNQETIKSELHRIGIKNTPKKAAILEIIKNQAAPLDASKLHLKASRHVTMDIATVYRTLQQFKEKGIVKEFLGRDGVIQYEYIGSGIQAHPHFQCERCLAVTCLDALGFEDAIYFSNMAKNHTIHSIDVTLSGVCESCQNQNQG